MKARVKVTPARMERLMSGKPLVYNVPAWVTELELVLDDGVFAKFDKLFSKTWNKVMAKAEKTISEILK